MTTPAEALREAAIEQATDEIMSLGYGHSSREAAVAAFGAFESLMRSQATLTSPAPAPDVATCSDCPPSYYPTDVTRCAPCPLRVTTAHLHQIEEPHKMMGRAPDVAGVVDYLRKRVDDFEKQPERLDQFYDGDDARIDSEAATLLTALSAELNQMVGIASDLRAENARMREALEYIADFANVTAPSSWAVDVQAITRRARTALSAPSERPATKEPDALQTRLLSAISDWKAPYEVADMVGCTGRIGMIAVELHKLVAKGLAKYHEGENTFRAIGSRENLRQRHSETLSAIGTSSPIFVSTGNGLVSFQKLRRP